MEVINASENNRDNRLRINRFEIMIVEKVHREFKRCVLEIQRPSLLTAILHIFPRIFNIENIYILVLV